jgi:hypothetical protein
VTREEAEEFVGAAELCAFAAAVFVVFAALWCVGLV